jgi:hypothetical protein
VRATRYCYEASTLTQRESSIKLSMPTSCVTHIYQHTHEHNVYAAIHDLNL